MKTNVDIIQLAEKFPDINITIKAGDLIEGFRACISETRKDLEQLITEANTETYPTPEHVAKILNVDKTTLWRWNKNGILKTIKVGGKTRYRMSDVKKFFEDDEVKKTTNE